MAKLALYSTSAGKGFDMRSDWFSKVGGSDIESDPAFNIETATSAKAGINASNYLAITYSAAILLEDGDYDRDNSTFFTFKAVDAGKTIFSFTEVNQTGLTIDNNMENYGAFVPANPTTQDLSKAFLYAFMQKADTITGTAYADVVTSWAGADTVNSGGGADKVYGGTSGDTLNGGSGDDKLYSETGNDTLTGGTGVDKFVFSTTLNATTNVDVITDFSHADDEMWLDNDVFTKAGAVGQLVSDAFHKGSSAADAQDRIIYNSSTGNLYYDKDGTGSSAKVLIAELDTGLGVTYTDFEVIG